jgi:nucleolar protein 6
MEKLRIKNERLAEQRRRKAEVTAKQRERGAAKNAEWDAEGGEKQEVAEEKDDQSGMHPSRRAQLRKY